MKAITHLVLIAVVLVVVGCSGGTRVIKDGFVARQVTDDAVRFMRPTRSWETICRWDQLTQEKASGQYFCPAPADKEAYNTVLAHAVVSPSLAETVIPASINGVALLGFGGLLYGGLSNMQAARMTQSVTGGGNEFYVSTLSGAPIGTLPFVKR